MLLTNGRFFIDGGFTRGKSVRIENGVISDIGILDKRSDENAYDLGGDMVIPSFVDIHIHGYGGYDVNGGEDSVRIISRELYKLGVGAFMPTVICQSVPVMRSALAGIQAVMNSQEAFGARVLGAHLEGPFLSPEYCGAISPEYMQIPSVEAYIALTEGFDCVKMVTLAVEYDGSIPLIRYLNEHGVIPCCAHSAATAEQARLAAQNGLKQITHIFNAQSPLKHRSPGVPGAGLACDELSAQVIADGVHLHPDTLRIVGLCKGAEQTLLITDCMMAGGMADGEYALGGERVYVRGGEARLKSGSLAGSTMTMQRALQNMVSLGGFPVETAIPMATSSPADSVGASGFGRIAVGCRAPLLRIDDDCSIKEVVGSV